MSRITKIAVTLSMAALITACAAEHEMEEMEVMETMEEMPEEMSMDTMEGKM